ncbi:MAG: type II toxin-antitoxin system RelE/ParE family toxin [Bacteroidales bacterium]|nr:type II toxin-antitoxin system RelE/ParE family toxin [Bacteroidales bacterium]
MRYKIIWLDEARLSLDAEMEYVYAEFGQQTLVNVYNDLMERVFQLQTFPRIGIRCEDLDYHGYEIRLLNMKKVTVVYAIVSKTVQILYIWNNQQDPNRLARMLGMKE